MPEFRPFGKYIISERIKKNYVSSEIFRAISAPEGKFEKFVLLKILNSELKGFKQLTNKILSHFENVLQLKNDHIGMPIEAGTYNNDTYVVYEFEHGKFLIDIFEKSIEEGMLLNFDHIITIIAKLLDALKAAHSKGLHHGFIIPHSILISYEGKVKLFDFVSAPHIMDQICQNSICIKRFENFVHPDVISSRKSSHKDDIFSVGLIMFQLLGGYTLIQNGKLPEDINSEIDSLEVPDLFNPEPVPDDLKNILKKALIPEGGYKTIHEFFNDISLLLEDDTYSPTTFNLSFAVHNIFRKEAEKESSHLDVEKSIDYSGYMTSAVEQTKVTSKKSLWVWGSLILISILAAALSIKVYFDKAKIGQEKEAIAEKAENMEKQISEIEQKMTEKIKVLEEEKQRLKNEMKQADIERNKQMQEELENEIRNEKAKLAEQINKREAKQVVEKKETDILKEDTTQQEHPEIQKKDETKTTAEKNKSEKSNIQESFDKSKIQTEYPAKEIKKESVELVSETTVGPGQDKNKKSFSTKNVHKEKKKIKSPDLINLIDPLYWSDTIFDVIDGFTKSKGTGELYFVGKDKKKVEFKKTDSKESAMEEIYRVLSGRLIDCDTENLNNDTVVYRVGNRELKLVITDFKWMGLNCDVTVIFGENPDFDDLLECRKSGKHYVFPVSIFKVEMDCNSRKVARTRKDIENYVIDEKGTEFKIIKDIRNRNTSSCIVSDKENHILEYDFESGSTFRGSRIKLIFYNR